MENRWSDEGARGLAPLDLLVHVSRLVGAEPSLAVWGGGNTSIKRVEPDLQGRPVEVLRVKGSGSDLKSVTARDFPGVRLDEVLALRSRREMADQAMIDYLARCLQEPGSPRPSIETLLHGFLPFPAIIHTHADAIVALTNNESGDQVVRDLFGKIAVTVGYQRPGFALSRRVWEAVDRCPETQGVILQKHGLSTWGATLEEAYRRTIDLVSRAEDRLAAAARGRRVFPTGTPPLEPATRREVVARVAPVLRGLLSRRHRVLLRFDDSPEVLDLCGTPEAARLTQVGPATPDHTLHSRRLPCYVPLDAPADPERVIEACRAAITRFSESHAAYQDAERREAPAADQALLEASGLGPERRPDLWDTNPRVLLLPGLGMLTAGKDARSAGITADVYRHTSWVIRAASAMGAYRSLTAAEAFGVEYWPLELYKLALAPPERELARRVAVVTGAAGGIGRAIARRLAREGAHVAVTDLDGRAAEGLAADIAREAVANPPLGLALDVTSEASIRTTIGRVVEAYGGLDILVSNAGIAHSAPIDVMTLKDWEQSFRVNATGHFLVTREVLTVLKRQGLGGSLVFVATKNVMSPGKDFAAYSAAKAAQAQLAKVAALEGAPHGIRVNIVSPDAVFRDSGLWTADVRRERARAQGIPVEELEEHYRRRNLLGVSILPEDVAEAVLFLASDRAAKTTGCTLTVDGGLRDAFPR